MTDYNDMPQVNALYTEQQQVRAAITYLSNGGAITSMMISAAVPDPSINPPPPMMTGIPVNIFLAKPNPQSLVDAALAALQARDDEITQELADLGVTDTPARTTVVRSN